MNMTLVDLGGAPSANPGEAVSLIGGDGAGVTADDWAQWADTINYEIVTRLPAELRREYISS
jgi:alanine racemase